MTAIAVPAGIEKYMEGKATIAGYEAITAAEKAGDTATCTILTASIGQKDSNPLGWNMNAQ